MRKVPGNEVLKEGYPRTTPEDSGKSHAHVDATLSLVALRAEAGDEQDAEALCRDPVRRIGPLDPCRSQLANP
jgi:hypothetical protein